MASHRGEYDPVYLGRRISDEISDAGIMYDFDANQDDILSAITIADSTAERKGFLNTDYYVNTANSFLIPRVVGSVAETTSWRMGGMAFKGNLLTYSMVKVGALMGERAIRAVCLAFDDVTMLPSFDKVRPKDLLHVPVYAVDEMEKMAA